MLARSPRFIGRLCEESGAPHEVQRLRRCMNGARMSSEAWPRGDFLRQCRSLGLIPQPQSCSSSTAGSMGLRRSTIASSRSSISANVQATRGVPESNPGKVKRTHRKLDFNEATCASQRRDVSGQP